ncbi:aldose 1-epimerase [human gut metagenome]|uniref:Aldose 1-epimerase n=1 Tax=human gut metagenome TaxID=408170 RepID=K1SYM1_9ZZZZ
MITTTDFGTLCDGRTVRLYTLKNNAIELSVTDYGSTLVRLLVPDKNGKPTDVVLGYDDLAGYVADDTCFGNNVGRSANRIGGASFTLNGTEYKLAANDGENNLHSGPDSYSKRIWNVRS